MKRNKWKTETEKSFQKKKKKEEMPQQLENNTQKEEIQKKMIAKKNTKNTPHTDRMFRLIKFVYVYAWYDDRGYSKNWADSHIRSTDQVWRDLTLLFQLNGISPLDSSWQPCQPVGYQG